MTWTEQELAAFAAAEATDRANGITSYAPLLVPDVAAVGDRLRFVTAADLRASTPDEPPWIVTGYLAKGNLTLVGGAPKVGKSRFALDLSEAVALGAESFAGRAVTGGKIVYVSEEGASTLAHKLGDTDRVWILTRDNAWPKPEWATLIEAAVTKALRESAVLLVIDTVPWWAGLPPKHEKDSGAAIAVMDALIAAASEGLAVLAQTHTRKGGGDDGEGLRGSSAFAGSADIVLELERVKDAPRQRALLALSRYPATPGTLVAELSPGGVWTVVDENVDRTDSGTIAIRQREAADRAAILAALEESPGLTRADLEAATSAPSRQWHPILDGLVKDGRVCRTGAGKKGDPYRFEIVRTNGAQAAAQNGAQTADAVIPLSARPRRGAERESSAGHPGETAQSAESEVAPPASSPVAALAETRRPGVGRNGGDPRRLADLSDAELIAPFPDSTFISEAEADALGGGVSDYADPEASAMERS